MDHLKEAYYLIEIGKGCRYNGFTIFPLGFPNENKLVELLTHSRREVFPTALLLKITTSNLVRIENVR